MLKKKAAINITTMMNIKTQKLLRGEEETLKSGDINVAHTIKERRNESRNDEMII